MVRVKTNFVSGVLDQDLHLADTTMYSSGLALLPTIASPDYAAITVDPDGLQSGGDPTYKPEILWVTAHTSGAAVATVLRHQEGSTAKDYPLGTTLWEHGATALDSPFEADHVPINDPSLWIDTRAKGAVHNGTADDKTPIQNALNTGATVVVAAGVTRISGALTPSSNQTVRLVKGATIKPLSSMASTACFVLDGLTNITIEGGTLDGDKTNNVNKGTYGIFVKGSSWVTVSDITIANFPGTDSTGTNGGDALYFGRSSGGVVPTDITLARVRCDGNVRQGMSVISVGRLTATTCHFLNTSGTNPGGGVDFEPNSSSDTIDDVEFQNCVFRANYKAITSSASAGAPMRNLTIIGGQATDSTSTSRAIFLDGFVNTKIIGMTVRNNAGYGIHFATGFLGRVQGCLIHNNGGHGIYSQIRGARMTDNTIYQNGMHGIYIGRLSPGPSGVVCTDNQVFNNGTLTADTYAGIYCDGVGAAQNQHHVISDNVCINSSSFLGVAGGVSQQGYGIWLDTDCKQCTVVGNDCSGNTVADYNMVHPEEHAEFSVAGSAATLKIGTGAIYALTRSTPATPLDNRGVLYVDTSSGKDRWVALHHGAAVDQSGLGAGVLTKEA